MMPKSTTVSWLAPGCWMSQTSPSESDTARRCGVCARARPWSRRGRPPPPVADWYDMQFGIDHVRRYISGSSRVVERDDNDHDISVQIDGTQGPKDGDVTRHIMVIDVNTEALELGSAPPAGSSGAHSSPRQTRPIRWPTTTG